MMMHDLLLPELDPSVSRRLRHSTVYHIPQVRTKRYCSFKNYSLKYCQWQLSMFVIAPFYFAFLCLYGAHICASVFM